MSRQAGLTLVELLTVVALGTLMLAASVVYSMPWIAREGLRGATADVRALLQLARSEAVGRNRACHLTLDSATGELRVWDGRGTIATTDDALLHRGRVRHPVRFNRPDGGGSVTLKQIGTSSRFATTFAADGTVLEGDGDVFLHGGESFGRISVHAAGAVEVRSWNGTGWSGEH